MNTINPIAASVGAKGSNKPDDAKVVQMLLNNWLRKIQKQPLKLDGIVGPKTLNAISDYQKFKVLVADSRVDPHGPTIKALVSFQVQLLQEGGSKQILEIAKHSLYGNPDFITSTVNLDLTEILNKYFHAVKNS